MLIVQPKSGLTAENLLSGKRVEKIARFFFLSNLAQQRSVRAQNQILPGRSVSARCLILVFEHLELLLLVEDAIAMERARQLVGEVAAERAEIQCFCADCC